MIVVIKIGENEPNTYADFSHISKHLDIVEVLHKKGNGQPYTSMGVRGDKEFFGLNVNTSHLTDEKILELKYFLREPYWSDIGTGLDRERLAKRVWYLDLNSLPFISEDTKTEITLQTENKRQVKIKLYDFMQQQGISLDTTLSVATKEMLAQKKEEFEADFDMKNISKLKIQIVFNVFANAVRNKKTGKTLAEEWHG